MYEHIPIIGIVGGIGSGKSHVAKVFGELGCAVINSDEQVTEAYHLPKVRRTIEQWWGREVFHADGQLNRKQVAARIFASPLERKRLEELIHPCVAQLRDVAMQRAARSPTPPLAFVWDSPLLFEAGLAGQCDAIVFVEAPLAVRLRRVQARGWDAAELGRRENSQWPLDKKRALSHYVITNAAEDANSCPATLDPARPTDLDFPDAAVKSDSASSCGLRHQVETVLRTIRSGISQPDGTIRRASL